MEITKWVMALGTHYVNDSGVGSTVGCLEPPMAIEEGDQSRLAWPQESCSSEANSTAEMSKPGTYARQLT
jgi:hypothetical protein